MPSMYIGTDIWIKIWYAGHLEYEGTVAPAVSSFPITFNVTENLYWFDGTYNSQLLEFEIWSSNNNGDPEKIFSIESRDLQLEYYPDIIGFDDGYGFKYEALLEYRN
jgi:hypothetical protein